MSIELKESDILSKIKNPLLLTHYHEFQGITNLKIKCTRLDNGVRASNEYIDGSDEFNIMLKNNWIEPDFAHELIHGYLMFVDKYAIIFCDNPVSQLIRDYMEDILVHRKMFNVYHFSPYDSIYIKNLKRWARDLFKGSILVDSRWDPKGKICKTLHKSFLYIQAWELNNLIGNDHIKKFITSFELRYKKEEEYSLAKKIMEVIKANNNLRDLEGYSNALNNIATIKSLGLSEPKIKHFEKVTKGYILI